MTRDTDRSALIEDTVSAIRAILDDGTDAERLSRASELLADLASHPGLFPRTEFPVPGDGHNDITTRLRQDDDGGFALYVNSGLAGQSFRPHDHGDNWAIVAGVEGRELHRIYDRRDDGSNPDAAELVLREEICLEPGGVIALPGNTIHSVEGQGDAPILHLHLYQKGYHAQAGRTEYDLEAGRAFFIPNLAQLDSETVSFD